MDAEQRPDKETASGQLTEKPEVTDKHREQAKEMAKVYEEQPPTVRLPGSGGAVSGTAVNAWIDDDGNPKFSDESKSQGAQQD